MRIEVNKELKDEQLSNLSWLQLMTFSNWTRHDSFVYCKGRHFYRNVQKDDMFLNKDFQHQLTASDRYGTGIHSYEVFVYSKIGESWKIKWIYLFSWIVEVTLLIAISGNPRRRTDRANFCGYLKIIGIKCFKCQVIIYLFRVNLIFSIYL